MTKHLKYRVYVAGTAYGPGPVPADVAALISNPKVWADPAAVVPTAPAPQPVAPAQTQPADQASTDDLIPEGEPSEDWNVKELRAWAKANEISLGGLRTKDEILHGLTAHLTAAELTQDGSSDDTTTGTTSPAPAGE